MEIYPYKFEPIYKEKIWGGRNLERLFGRRLPADVQIGESWDLADLTCSGDGLVDTVIDVANKTATVTLQYNDLNPLASQADVTCTFVNKTLPSLTIVKKTVEAYASSKRTLGSTTQ